MDLNALRKINYGVYIISSRKNDGSINGQIANTVFQVTSEPAQIAVCINTQNYTHEFISESGVFSVSVLSKEAPMKFIGQFGFKSGRDLDKFKDIKHILSPSGTPVVIENSVTWLDAKAVSKLDVGTHTIFVGKISGGEVLGDAEPMTYDFYHLVKGGKSPKAAPTYIPDNKS
ncbi:MAG: flavin reductase family protein [Candidatus Margulisiibacteriota bacterium]